MIWTWAHRREALPRTYELAAEVARRGTEWWTTADAMCIRAPAGTVTERGFRAILRDAVFDPARIDREVRRVDGLATGRLVRETTLKLRDWQGQTLLDGFRTNEEHVRREARACCGILVRVTRIRRRAL